MKKLHSAVTWRARFLLDRRFALRERLAYVHPLGRQLEEAELVARALRRGRDGRSYYALGAARLYFEPDAELEDARSYRECVELVLRETFLDDELFDDRVRLERGDVVFDLGASIGTCALLFSRRVGPEGRVHAFEPLVPEVLERNVRENRLRNVTVVPSAVGACPGEADLAFNDDFVSASIARDPGAEEARPLRRRTVPVCTIDEYVESNGLERVDVLKLDVEGAEELALRGAERTLTRLRPRLTIASYHTDHEGEPQHPKLVRLLEGQGYRTRSVEQRRIYAW